MTGGGTIVIAVLVVLNLVTFAVFGWDKLCARAGRRRVSEHALLTLMAVGGSPGGWAAMLLFRHKTQKASFRTRQSSLPCSRLQRSWCLRSGSPADKDADDLAAELWPGARLPQRVVGRTLMLLLRISAAGYWRA